MEVRYQELKESIDGLIQTGIPLITYDGKNFGSSGVGDDIGAYYFIPKIAVLFDFEFK